MKNLLLIILGLNTPLILTAQEEPEAIEGKDLIEIDAPEFEEDNVEINMGDFMSDIEIPAIKTSSAGPVKSSSADSNSIEPATNQTVSVKKPNVKRSSTDLNVNQLKKNDLIQLEDGQIWVFRRNKKDIIKYKFRSSLSFGSDALEKKGESSFYVRNPAQLVRDTKDYKNNKENKPQTALETKPIEDSRQVIKAEEVVDTSDLRERRAKIENEVYGGKLIEKEILLKNLRVNDLIYIFDDIQLVVRKKKATSGYTYSWLTEAINVDSSSLEKSGNNKFKVRKLYKNK